MTIKKKEEWRELCDRVAVESDPQRLSELVDKLVEALDARKQALSQPQEQHNPLLNLTADDT